MSLNTTRIAKENSARGRIFQNTLMLYFRQILSMGVSLYTVRVVLETLGVEDYGIYNVVYGIAAMIGFLNGTLSTAVGRFFTYELGNNNYERLKNTFAAARTISILLSAVVVLIAETIGMWFLLHKLVIPVPRMGIALGIYQFSIVSIVLQFLQIPYIAAIMAHEQMNVFARMEILNGGLKLLSVYLLILIAYDKLLTYCFLLLCTSVTISIFYRIYCFRKVPESKSSLCIKNLWFSRHLCGKKSKNMIQLENERSRIL